MESIRRPIASECCEVETRSASAAFARTGGRDPLRHVHEVFANLHRSSNFRVHTVAAIDCFFYEAGPDSEGNLPLNLFGLLCSWRRILVSDMEIYIPSPLHCAPRMADPRRPQA